jgi:hypothetical protein
MTRKLTRRAVLSPFDLRRVTTPVLLHLLRKELADGAKECTFVWEHRAGNTP